MKTSATTEFPEIEWSAYSSSIGPLKEGEDMHEARGKDRKGNYYSAMAFFVDKVFREIRDIQKETPFCALCGSPGATNCNQRKNCLDIAFVKIL